MGFMHLRMKFKENFKLKTKLIKAEISILDKSRKNFFQLPNAVKSFKIHPMALDLTTLSNNQNLLKNLALEIFFILLSKKNTKNGQGLPFND